MKKRNTVCHNGKQNNLSKGTPVATPVPPPTPTTATPVTVLSTARSKPSKRARPAQSTKRSKYKAHVKRNGRSSSLNRVY